MNVLILSVLCISLLPVTGLFENMQAKDPSAAYTPHVAIIIDSNEALASFCTGSGTGTESDPYVIEGFSITGYPIGISISNTDAYLCIRGNEIKHQTEKGIYVAGAQNVNISNNVFVNASYAAYIDTCQNIEYSWNTSPIHNAGLFLEIEQYGYKKQHSTKMRYRSSYDYLEQLPAFFKQD